MSIMIPRHLAIRLSQRNISPTIVSLVLSHGVYIRDGQRIRALVLERDLRYLSADGLPDRVVQQVRSTMVITDASGTPVTAYHPTHAKLQRTKGLTQHCSYGG
jgi:hypothetical protein